MDFSPGVHVWVASDTDVAVPAEVVDGFSPGDEGKVRTPAGEEIMLTTEQTAALEPMDEQTLTAVEDPALHENPRRVEDLGTCPIILWIDPVETVDLEITLPGARRKVMTLESPKQHRVTIRLTTD